MSGGHSPSPGGQGDDGVGHYLIEFLEDNITAPPSGFQLGNNASERFTKYYSITDQFLPTFKWRDGGSYGNFWRQVTDPPGLDKGVNNPFEEDGEVVEEFDAHVYGDFGIEVARRNLSLWAPVIGNVGDVLDRLYITDGTYVAWVGLAFWEPSTGAVPALVFPGGAITSASGIVTYPFLNYTTSHGFQWDHEYAYRITRDAGVISILVRDVTLNSAWFQLLQFDDTGWGSDITLYHRSRAIERGNISVKVTEFNVLSDPLTTIVNFENQGTGTYTSGVIPYQPGKYISSIAVVYDNVDSSNYFGILITRTNGTPLAQTVANIETGTEKLLTDADFDNPISEITEDVLIKTYLVGDANVFGPRIFTPPFATFNDYQEEPIIGITSPVDGKRFNPSGETPVTWLIQDIQDPVEDITLDVEYRFEGGAWQPLAIGIPGDSPPLTWYLGGDEGSYSLRITATDTEGYSSTDQVNISVYRNPSTGGDEEPPPTYEPPTCGVDVTCVIDPITPPPYTGGDTEDPPVYDPPECGVDVVCIIEPVTPPPYDGGDEEPAPIYSPVQCYGLGPDYTVKGFWNPVAEGGLPPEVINDWYICSEGGYGWTAGRVYRWIGSWAEYNPSDGERAVLDDGTWWSFSTSLYTWLPIEVMMCLIPIPELPWQSKGAGQAEWDFPPTYVPNPDPGVILPELPDVRTYRANPPPDRERFNPLSVRPIRML